MRMATISPVIVLFYIIFINNNVESRWTMMLEKYDFVRILIRMNIRNIIPVCVYFLHDENAEGLCGTNYVTVIS